jgi:hypothetical protein
LLLLRYLALELLAPWRPAALALFALAVTGAVHLASARSRPAAVMLAVPVSTSPT